MMDFSKRLESLESMVKDVIQLLQQNPKSPGPGSRATTLQEDPIISRLDGLSKGVAQLKQDIEGLESLNKKLQSYAHNAHETADNNISLGANCVTSNSSPLPSSGSGGNDLCGKDATNVITISNMGYELVESLSRYGTDFSGKIHVSGFDSFDLAKISTRLVNPVAPATLTVQHSSIAKNGVSKLSLARKAEFNFPDFSDLPRTAPQGYDKSFESIIASPPQKPVSYYVGSPLTPDFNTLLSPGRLLELGEIPGVTTPYWHAGEKDSGTAFHYEDGAVRSCNVTIAGFKLWILIKVSSNTKFEGFIQTLHPSAPRCGQWLRHLNILVSPETLAEMDIGFDLILAGPGDMVVTAPGQYHAVLNLTTCFAIAINFALPEDPVLAPTVVCPECGLYGLEHPALKRLERKVSPNVARRGRSAKGHAESGSTRRQAVARPDHQPDDLEPTANPPDRDESLADDVVSAAQSVGSEKSTRTAYAADINTNEDESGRAQADESAVGSSPQGTDEEATELEDRDWEHMSQGNPSPPVISTPASHHSTTRSPCSPRIVASSSSPPTSSAACSTIPFNLTAAIPSPPPWYLDHGLSTDQSSQTRGSPTSRSSINIEVTSISHPVTSPASSTQCEQQFLTSSLARGGPTQSELSHEHIAKRLCLPSADTTTSDELLEADPHCNIPRFDMIAPPDAHILRLATAVRSRHAVQQFCDLVKAKRDLRLHNVLFPTYYGNNAVQRLVILNGLRKSKIITSINQYFFAGEIEKARHGTLRVASEIKKDIIQASGLAARQYEYHLHLGNRWRKISEGFEGILCFILSDKHNPFHVSAAMYRNMNDHELRVFHNLLADDYTQAICTAGKAFQQSLGARDSSFAWETSKLTNPLYKLPENDMLSYIKPIPLLPEDKHCAAEFPDWPDPTLIPPTQKQCDFCSSHSCDCYVSNAPKTRPRIMTYPGKGLGLQASSAELGTVVYRRNELIGFLTGKLVPPGTLDNDRVVEFHECQIDCRDEGNEFRLMNHACATHAVARLAKKRVSGRFRQSVVALRNIHNGAELTITYSEEHDHPCEGCKAHQNYG